MFGFMHSLENEICKLIPKGAFVVITERPLGINLRTRIKSIGNHAKKSYLAEENSVKSSFWTSRVCLDLHQVF